MQDNLIYDTVKSSKNDKKAFVVIHGWKGNKNSFKTIASLLKFENVTWFFVILFISRPIWAHFSRESRVSSKKWFSRDS